MIYKFQWWCLSIFIPQCLGRLNLVLAVLRNQVWFASNQLEPACQAVHIISRSTGLCWITAPLVRMGKHFCIVREYNYNQIKNIILLLLHLIISFCCHFYYTDYAGRRVRACH